MNVSITLKGLPENITIGQLRNFEKEIQEMAKLKSNFEHKVIKSKPASKPVEEILKEMEE